MAGRYPAVAEDTTNKVVKFPNAAENKEISDKDAKKIAIKSRPRGMSKAEQQVWNNDMPEYVKINRFKPHYVRFFKEYCIVIARMEAALAYLEEHDWKYTTEGRNGIQHKTRPEASQYNDDWRKLNSLINQIGGSPATDQRFNNLQPGLFDDVY
ncbi:P27 family phage terminase small subunit [Pseudoalteromonas sp. NZS37]|uniref:P27 family phage terminase small subunit n=1 Tax=Pseudoalteromonas sp. NZS37 TaxID=2792071 RepID=UPI0018CD40EC|nr:P27 family phage terminase small subunit [Pseudoalteromonas sp. NZS37]MBG9991590.1 P27 family phage terminase small subunit [Pseudoalteromonas sp. NZS37]